MVSQGKIRIKVIAYTLGFIFLTIFSTLIYTMVRSGFDTSKNTLPEYNALFAPNALPKLKVLSTYKSNIRQATSSYIYDDKFNVFVYKIILSKEVSLKNLISCKNEGLSIFQDLNITSGLPSLGFQMKINSWQTSKVSSIELVSAGDSIQSIIMNDSLFCYYLKFKKFAIGYNNSAYDIVGYADKLGVPISLAFIEKKNFVYGVLMSKAEDSANMQPDLLYSIIKK
jgi:hypothetical protein